MRSYFVLLALATLSAPANAVLLVSQPREACALLGGSGLMARGWKNQYDNEFGCASPYKEIGVGNPLANNLSYYVEGTRTSATRATLVLNINNKAVAAFAHAELLKAAQALSPKLTGAALPNQAATAITNGTAASVVVGAAKVEVVRFDWPTGKGYGIKMLFE